MFRNGMRKVGETLSKMKVGYGLQADFGNNKLTDEGVKVFFS